MKECVCCQCCEHPIGYAPKYYQCSSCQLFGTVDDFTDGDGDTCDTCVAAETKAKETK